MATFDVTPSKTQLPPDIEDSDAVYANTTKIATKATVPTVAVFGTGDFGRVLTSLFLQNGYKVVCGSRYPTRRSLGSRDSSLTDVPVVDLVTAAKEAPIILLAIPAKVMVDTLRPLSKVLMGKILIDVSNNSSIKEGPSNAEMLAAALPGSMIVKAFNTLSAYSLQSGQDSGNNEVQIASDSPYAREMVCGMARDLGLQAQVYGGIRTARELEKIPLRLWRGWGSPVVIMAINWIAWGIYGTWRYHDKKARPWSRWPLNTSNKIFACTAITLLALCFLPGSIAAVVQLINGTKHKAFPRWLDSWLKQRKQLGLLALWMAGVHCILSAAQLSPNYYPKWFLETSITLPYNETASVDIPILTRMNWKGEVAIVTGCLSLAFMVLLGITSLPSVGRSLNWRQWVFVQSFLGHVCLFIAVAHVSIKVLPYIFWRDFYVSVQSMSFISTWLPTLAVVFRLILLLPCCYYPIWKIRSGWERGRSSKDEECIVGGRAGANMRAYANQAYSINQDSGTDPATNAENLPNNHVDHM